jgi:hypothetical protein
MCGSTAGTSSRAKQERSSGKINAVVLLWKKKKNVSWLQVVDKKGILGQHVMGIGMVFRDRDREVRVTGEFETFSLFVVVVVDVATMAKNGPPDVLVAVTGGAWFGAAKIVGGRRPRASRNNFATIATSGSRPLIGH